MGITESVESAKKGLVEMSTKLYDISDWCKRGPEVKNYPYIGEIDASINLFEVICIDGDYYVPGVLSADKTYAGVSKIEIDLEPSDRKYKNNLTCPYCGYADNNSWELSSDCEEEHECSRCGGVMSYERIVTVEYSSSPVKPPVVVEASWK